MISTAANNSGIKVIGRQRGFQMIEVLISMFVLAVGILGIGALQVKSVQHNTSALYRTQAVQLSYEILDRIRANPEANYTVAMGASPTVGNCNGVVTCDSAAMRNHDLTEWKCSMGAAPSIPVTCSGLTASLINSGNSLPAGDGSVARVVGADSTEYTITVQWADTRRVDGDGDSLVESFVLVSRL